MYYQIPQRSHRWWFGWVVLLLLQGCGAAPAAQPSPPPAPAITATPARPEQAQGQPTTAGIQATLDRYASIVQSGQADDVRAIVDPKASAVQRIMTGITNELQAQVPPDAALAFTAFTVIERTPTLAEVLVERSWDQRRYAWLFRLVDGQWLLAQPTREELGAEHVVDTDGLSLHYHGWDAQLAQNLLPRFVEARQHVLTTLGVQTDSPVIVTLRSTLGPGDEGGKGVFIAGKEPARDRIDLFTVGAAFGSFGPEETWEQALSAVLAHEYTHRVNTRAPELQPMDEMPSWMTEGLAEYVAGQEHLDVPAFRQLVLDDTMLSLCALNEPNPTASRGVLYGFSQQAVAYIVEQRGGLSAFWNLAAVYRTTPGGGKERMERAVTTSWGEPCGAFDQAWHAWMRQRAANF